jgi:hypothetical protein
MSNYSPGWKGFRDITAVSIKDFKKWLYRGRKQRQPFADYVYIQKKKIDEMKKVIKLKESDIMNIIANSVKKVLKESYEPSRRDWDDFGEWSSSDEPDLWQDEMNPEDSGILIDTDDEGSGYSAKYMGGMEYGKHLLSKGKNVDAIKAELLRKEENGTISPFEEGILDTIAEDDF